MKKALCMIALAAISYGSVYAAAPTLHQDTTKSKVKSKNGKMKMKKKMKDTSSTDTTHKM
jgi:hypothetical protein